MWLLPSWLVAWFSAAPLAANAPVITAPSGQYILPAAATALKGIGVSVAGGTPSTLYTVSLSCTGCTFTATGNNLAGSGTSTITAGPSTSANLLPVWNSLKIVWPANDVNATDIVTITAVSGGVNAVPETMAIVVDGSKYLVHSAAAASDTRSQQQCAALAHPCDGTFTQYWWPTTRNTDGTGAVKTVPGDPCFDRTVTSACGDGTSAGTGLSSSEQSALVPATSVALPLPVGK